MENVAPNEGDFTIMVRCCNEEGNTVSFGVFKV
jgi:hypothetical protein